MNHQHRRRTAAVTAAILCCTALLPSAAAQQPASVVVARVIEREVNSGHRVVGTVEPIRRSTIGTAVEGRVIEFPVERGDFIRAGTVLAQLQTGTLQIELKAARTELRLRQEMLSELENGSRPEEIREARARLKAAEAVRSNSAAQLERLEALRVRNAVQQTEIDDARERAEAAAQTATALQAALELIEAGPREEQIAQAASRVRLQEAQIELLEDRISKYTITAPFDGFVTQELTEVGEWVSSGQPVASIVALDQVEVICSVPAEQAVRLQVDRTVRVEFSDLPGSDFSGVVRRIVPQADNSSRTFPVSVLLPNQIVDGRPLLMAGMLARAVLPTGSPVSMPLVPKDAVVLKGNRRSVFAVQTDSAGRTTVREVPVLLGVAEEGLTQAEGDLKPGEAVVIRGNERLRDGQEVTVTSEAADS